MLTNTIITIVTLALLMGIIYVFAYVAFNAIIKSEKTLVMQGLKDGEIIDAHQQVQKTRKQKRKNRLSLIFSIAFISLMAFFVASCMFYRAKGNIFWTGDTSTMVIASDSMSTIGDKESDIYHQKVSNGGYLTDDMIKEEFSRGDILQISHVPNQDALVTRQSDGSYAYVTNGRFGKSIDSPYLNKIFAFTYQSETIVHRLVLIQAAGDGTLLFEFQGDAYPGNTQTVTYNRLIGQVRPEKTIRKVGYVVLFFQSAYGAFVILGAVGMLVLSSLMATKVEKIYESRYPFIPEDLKQEKEREFQDRRLRESQGF